MVLAAVPTAARGLVEHMLPPRYVISSLSMEVRLRVAETDSSGVSPRVSFANAASDARYRHSERSELRLTAVVQQDVSSPAVLTDPNREDRSLG